MQKHYGGVYSNENPFEDNQTPDIGVPSKPGPGISHRKRLSPAPRPPEVSAPAPSNFTRRNIVQSLPPIPEHRAIATPKYEQPAVEERSRTTTATSKTTRSSAYASSTWSPHRSRASSATTAPDLDSQSIPTSSFPSEAHVASAQVNGPVPITQPKSMMQRLRGLFSWRKNRNGPLRASSRKHLSPT